ncbi:restriction endonuclease subunit S [Aeromonas hydrophila]
MNELIATAQQGLPGKYKPYPEYKDSGVELLGKVPSHWQRLPLKYLVDMKSGESITATDIEQEGNYPVFGGNGLRGYTSAFTHTGSYILIGRQGALCGNVNYAVGQFWASEHALVVTAKKPINIKWLGELLRAMDLNQYSITAAQPGLSAEALLNLQIALPSEPECESIAAFLDYETARIDRLIAQQQRLIELLKEKRQAVISHAVTKGLNPDVPMKYSGVEWLGQVPEHWVVARLKQVIESGSSISYGIVQPGDALDEGVPFIQTTNISQGKLALEALPKTSKSIEESYPRSRLNGGEVILGIRASIGAAYVVPEELKGANLSRGVARIQPSDLISSEFLVWFFQTNAVEQYWGLNKQGSTFSEVSIETVRELSVVIPSDKEQLEICSYVQSISSKFKSLIDSAEMQNKLLIERRTALISAAVTGKIDLRDWTPPTDNEVTA